MRSICKYCVHDEFEHDPDVGCTHGWYLENRLKRGCQCSQFIVAL